ncbi:MAG: exosome complex protein Rrp42 [archaeon]
MNEEIKAHINEALKKGIRADGRKRDEFRQIEITANMISTAEGSAMVKCGETVVVAGIKLEVAKPYPDTQEDGVMMVGSELLPMSNPRFESGPPSIESIEVARVIDRGIREGKAIDTKKLCIRAGELVWNVMIDIVPLNYDGNLIDVGGMAALTALYCTKMPELKNDKIVIGSKTDKMLPVTTMPVPVTVFKVGDNFILDPTDDEEKGIDARLTVAVLEDGTLCAMQKGGTESLTAKDINDMVDLAIRKSHDLRQKVKEALR